MAISQRSLMGAAAAAALAGAFALPVWAQNTAAPAAAPLAAHTASPTPRAHLQAPRPAPDMAARHAQHMERLKPLLQLTDTQEGAWQTYVQSTRPAQRQVRAPADREAWRQLTTPQRIEKMQSLRQARTSQLEQRENATKAFYSSLSPAQQKAFDAAIPLHAGGHKHHMGPHRGHGPHQGHPVPRGHGPAHPAPAAL